jgi:hypothetical protein
MKQIEKAILAEKMSETPDTKYIHKLQQILDRKHITFDEFKQTGRLKACSDLGIEDQVSNDCHHVMTYVGNYAIEFIAPDKVKPYFMVYLDGTTFMSSSLLDVEKMMWHQIVNKELNEKRRV